MPISDEMRRLQNKWRAGTGWPKRLEWIEISGLRGWSGQRFSLPFPVMAVVGENGAGKSTLLQCAASVYKQPPTAENDTCFASGFFPDTAWDKITNATIGYEIREGSATRKESVRKPGERWRGNPKRPDRHVEYIDLSRIQPVSARVGYARLANPKFREVSADAFDRTRLARLGQIMGREYELAKRSLTDADEKRSVLVLGHLGTPYSGFHGGAGETTISEFLEANFPEYGIVLIDEIETSLHPRTQRRLMRDLAALCRERELQIVLTTHSPYILDELPHEARAFIMLGTDGQRSIMYGVSPEFAMSKMDDVPQYECDLYVEDERAKTMLSEILAAKAQPLVQRCRIIAYGAASVGKALGQMVAQDRFPHASRVFLDGDEGPAPGCINLPGEDAPERVVMGALKKGNWFNAADRTGRPFADIVDACERAMTLGDHHEWVRQAATQLVLGGDTLWQAQCAEWAKNCLDADEAARIVQSVQDAVDRIPLSAPAAPAPLAPGTLPRRMKAPKASSSSGPLPLFER
jgi:predicted ATPase